MEWILQLDTRLFLLINGWHNETWDTVMWWISGKTTWWPFYLALLLYLGWVRRWQVGLMILFIIVTVALTDQTSVHFFKEVFQRLRPCHEPALQELVHRVNNKCGGQFGFISSHAANTFGVAALISWWIRKGWLTAVLVLWAALVSYSRVYLGVHYPGDVIAGALWGATCGWFVYWLVQRVNSWIPERWWIKEGI